MCLELKEGAFLISDAHYAKDKNSFLEFLKFVKKRKPPQFILFGDIFDTLFGGINATYEKNREAIDVLNSISKEIEVIYLEGNHDFNLSSIFTNVMIVPLEKQPLKLNFKDKIIYLAHGDIYNKFQYNIYTKIIRHPLTLRALSLFDKIILKKLDTYLSKKNDCKEMINFEDIIKKRASYMPKCDYFIEGHFHQDKKLEVDNIKYINLAAFACNQRYYIVQSNNESQLLLQSLSFTEV